MKKAFSLILVLTFLLSFAACGNAETEQANELATDFIEALLLRDEDAMKKLVHPDYTDEAIPSDDFYKSLEEDHYFTVGNTLTAIEGTINYIEKTDIEGTVMSCNYVVRTNELFYNVDLVIVDNDNGYGVVSVNMVFNEDMLLNLMSEE